LPGLDEKINEIKRKIEDIRNRWPAHSAKPAMFRELEELELELEVLEKQKKEQGSSTG